MTTSFETLRGWFKASLEATADWRDEARELVAFVDGDQWTEEDSKKLRDEGRPAVVFNRTSVIVDAVCGAEINNRHETSFRPQAVEDAAAAEIMTEAVRWVRHRAQADDEESDAFRDMVTIGMGWSHTRPDLEGERPEIALERVDPLSMVWDHTAAKRNLRDRRYHFRVRRIASDEAREIWGEDPIDLDARWANLSAIRKETSGTPGREYDSGRTIGGAAGGETPRWITLVEAEWIERETVWTIVAQTPEGVIPQEVLDAKQRRIIEDDLKARGWQYEISRRRRKVYWRGVLGSNSIIEAHKMDPQKGGFRFKCLTAKRRNQDKDGFGDSDGYVWYGIAKDGKDPQQWANKFFSQILHIINTSALGGALAEEDAVVDPKKTQRDWAKPGAWIWLNPGGLDKIRERDGARYPETIGQMMQFAIQSIRDCMGVNPELLGQVQREQPGVLEYQRRQAGMNVLAVIFDALTQYREEQGYLMAQMVLTHLNDGRLIRITGPTGERYVPLVFEKGAMDFDLRVTEAPSAPDQKERMWGFIEKMMPYLMAANLGPDVWAEIVRYSPLPASIADTVAESLMERGQGGPSPAEQAEMAKAQAETAEKQASAELKQAQAIGEAADAKLAMARAAEIGGNTGQQQGDGGAALAKMVSDLIRAYSATQADQARSQRETALTAAKIDGMQHDQTMAEMGMGLQAMQALMPPDPGNKGE